MRHIQFLIVPAVLAFLSACSSKEKPAENTQTAAAPNAFKVKFETSKGPITMEIHRDWAPNGVDRFYELVKGGFFDEARFFRVVPNFVVQWGLNRDPKVSEAWRQRHILDDTVRQSNLRGYVTFATSGPNSRTTQLFINLKDNAPLDSQGFAPFGKVVSGMDAVDNIFSAYGDTPRQDLIQSMGNDYLKSQFPNLDYIKTTQVEQ